MRFIKMHGIEIVFGILSIGSIGWLYYIVKDVLDYGIMSWFDNGFFEAFLMIWLVFVCILMIFSFVTVIRDTIRFNKKIDDWFNDIKNINKD